MTGGAETPSATSLIRRLRGVTWKWRDDAPARVKERPGIGVIAQDVEAVFPELVDTGPEGYKRVNYVGLIAPLIEAVKELDERVQALEARQAEPEDPHARPPGSS